MCDLICGTYFKHHCRVQLTNYKDARTPEFSVKTDPYLENDYVFCKPEFLAILKELNVLGDSEFTLVTHNSDINFDKEYVEAVVEFFPHMIHWYTQNLLYNHPKVSPIPIGIGNPKWSHGNQTRFKDLIKKDIKKSNNVYINFNVSTNARARNYCLHQLNTSIQTTYPNAAVLQDHDEFVNSTQEKYLTDIASSYFTVPPIGNGVDCHKTWEALYMKSVPIVTRWFGVEKFKEQGIPFLILDDWSDFKNLKLDKELYDEVWGDFNPSSLEFSLFKENG